MSLEWKNAKAIAAVVITGIALSGCSSAANIEGSDNDALTVYATTGYIADAVSNIAPNAKVETMVGPGGDPHTYQPSTQDVEKIQKSDVVIWNGLHLEAQMLDLLESLGDRQLAVGEQVSEDLLLPWPETDDKGNPLFDPHIWNSPKAWSIVVEDIAEKLGEMDPNSAAVYQQNAEKYQSEIDKADSHAQEVLGAIPAPRVLITGHDAFNYFGDTYGLDVRATDFVSTEAALSATELSELADFIVDNKVPVIFQDNQANPQAIKSLQEAVINRGWRVEISNEELFADSLGPTAPTNTYLGVYRHNTDAVAEALVN